MRTFTLLVTKLGIDAGLVFFSTERCTNRDFGHVRVRIAQPFSNRKQNFYVQYITIPFCVVFPIKIRCKRSHDPSAEHRKRTFSSMFDRLQWACPTTPTGSDVADDISRGPLPTCAVSFRSDNKCRSWPSKIGRF
jgi:hypothetical protein